MNSQWEKNNLLIFTVAVRTMDRENWVPSRRTDHFLTWSVCSSHSTVDSQTLQQRPPTFIGTNCIYVMTHFLPEDGAVTLLRLGGSTTEEACQGEVLLNKVQQVWWHRDATKRTQWQSYNRSQSEKNTFNLKSKFNQNDSKAEISCSFMVLMFTLLSLPNSPTEGNTQWPKVIPTHANKVSWRL